MSKRKQKGRYMAAGLSNGNRIFSPDDEYRPATTYDEPPMDSAAFAEPPYPRTRTRARVNGGASSSTADPTENVKALNEASHRRQDDLRELSDRRIDAAFRYVGEVANLRAAHAKEIREIESNRLNAIRQVDVLAVNTAADRALAAIQTLAATTTADADTLRSMVSSTATTIATQTDNTVKGIMERIGALEKSAYEDKGRAAYSDPMLKEMISEMKHLSESRATGSGKSEGLSMAWAVVLGGVGLIGTLMAIAGSAFFILR